MKDILFKSHLRADRTGDPRLFTTNSGALPGLRIDLSASNSNKQIKLVNIFLTIFINVEYLIYLSKHYNISKLHIKDIESGSIERHIYVPKYLLVKIK